MRFEEVVGVGASSPARARRRCRWPPATISSSVSQTITSPSPPRPAARSSPVGRIRELPLDLGHGVARRAPPSWSAARRASSAPCSAWPSRSAAHNLAVDRVVGDDQGFGRPGEQVDADRGRTAGAWPRRRRRCRGRRPCRRAPMRLGAERHRGDRLHAAEAVDLVGAGEMHRDDDRRMRACPWKGGAQAMMRGTPATRAVTTLMCAEATRDTCRRARSSRRC